jgi:hypothetical protein
MVGSRGGSLIVQFQHLPGRAKQCNRKRRIYTDDKTENVSSKKLNYVRLPQARWRNHFKTFIVRCHKFLDETTSSFKIFIVTFKMNSKNYTCSLDSLKIIYMYICDDANDDE